MEVAGSASVSVPCARRAEEEGFMGIFGAMTTAVSGLRSQAYALENISGNIANSQTTGFKRVETSFVDLLPEMPYRKELAGSVTAFSRLTNTIQGDLQSTGVSTHMALNGQGFFMVQERTGYQNNVPTFGGVDLYTRRGDFTLDKDGFLVNGAGYYLRGSSIDPLTGDTVGTGNGVIQVSSEPLAARATTEILYRANLPTRPGTTNMQADVPLSELLGAPPAAPTPPAPAFPAGYDPRIPTLPAAAGAGFVVGSDVGRFMNGSIEGGLIPAYNAVGARIDVQMRWAKVLGTAIPATRTGTADISTGPFTMGAGNGGNLTINGLNIPLLDGDNTSAILTKINAQTATTGVTASLQPTTNRLVLTAEDGTTAVDLTGSTAATITRLGQDTAPLLTSPTPTAGETWNLFYLENGSASNNVPAWRNVGVPFVFNSSGQMITPTNGEVNIPSLTVDGNTLGSVTVRFGAGGLTQYASADGRVQQSTLQQDGYASGILDSVSVTSDGRISGSYTNGRVVPVAQISIAQFNADNALRRRDGGVYEQTLESGLPIIGLNGATIIGGNIESSNTDIAEEFSKMIVTQQAYSANTRVVSSAQQMLADVLNMIR
jgi:flagellar hook protein FlgE